MIIRLGDRQVGAPDAVELLLECHGRIRRFTAMAGRLAAAAGAADEEVRATAAQIGRYFTEALPLHVEDEDESIAAALAGRDAALDAALAAMTAEHVDHGPAIARVVELCDRLARDPRAHAELASELGAAGAALEALFAPHLDAEERTVFPALAGLPTPDRDALLADMRARRTP